MSSEKLCLKWNDFQENILSGFKDLRSDEEFTDVTLACEDGQQIGAHKVVLTTSSPLFRNLLKSNKHQHPLIYMRGIKSEDLMAIVDFLYCGEANVYPEHLDAFLALANELKLKGLTGEDEKQHDAKGPVPPKNNLQEEMLPLSTHSTQPNREDQLNEPTQPNQPNPTQPKPTQPNQVSLQTTESLQEEMLSQNTHTTQPNRKVQLDEQIKSMMETNGNFITRTNGMRQRVLKCKVCGKEGEDFDVRRHVEANHLTKPSHSCDICGKTSKSRNGLRQHTEKEHRKLI